MKRQMRFGAFCLFGLVAGCQQGGGISQNGAAVKTVASAADLKAKMDAGDVTVVHALNAEHYARGHVPGAVNIDYEKMTPKMLPSRKDHALVFYCAGPGCPVSDMAAHKAARWGYTNVWVYKGGIKGWRAAGMKVATGP